MSCIDLPAICKCLNDFEDGFVCWRDGWMENGDVILSGLQWKRLAGNAPLML